MNRNRRKQGWSMLVALVAVVGPVSPALGANWSAWRGEGANGFVESGAPVREFSEEKNLRWKVDLPGRGCSTPIVWGDRIIVTTSVAGEDGVLCFSREGKEQWRHIFGKASGPQHQSAGSGSNPSPTTDGERVYVYFKSGTLAALDLAGKVVWERNLQSDHGGNTLKWDLGTSPVLAAGKLVIAVMQTNGDSFLLAVDPATGKDVWKTKRDLGAASESGDGYSTPLVRTIGGKQALLTWGADFLTAHDAASGDELWKCGGFNDERRPKLRTIASPVEAGGTVLVPASRGNFVAAVSLEKKEIAWRRDLGPDSPSPVAWKDTFLVLVDRGRERGTVHCLRASDGGELWQHTFPRSVKIYYSSPLLVGNTLICSREDGAVFVGTVTEKGLEDVTENQLDDTLVASPVVVDDLLILRGHEKLYCFGKE